MALPRFIVIQPTAAISYVYHKDDGSVANGKETVFSPLVKIEAEHAKSNDKYIHLRFCHSNKYWQKNADNNYIVAVSNKPEEDTTKPSCTLFEANVGENSVSLTHVQTGWRVVQDTNLDFKVKNISATYFVNYLHWESIVPLPKHVAFMGDNGKYLRAYESHKGHKFLQFASDDPNDAYGGHEVSLMRDGHVRIKSDYYGKFWRLSPGWIWGDSTDVTANNKDTLFWPFRVDSETIALQSVGNGMFCKRLTSYWVNCLNASVRSITTETKMKVRELVAERKVRNVRYRMEDYRIFNETPYLAGTTTVTNNSDKESSMAVSITYTDQKSQSFSNSTSHTFGVSLTFEITKVPFIGAGGGLDFSYEYNTTKEWNTTNTITTSGQFTNTVSVPAKSRAIVGYVGTTGTCEVPFSYTYQDTSSIDGKITETDQIDGVYTGVNSYNFSFVVEEIQHL